MKRERGSTEHGFRLAAALTTGGSRGSLRSPESDGFWMVEKVEDALDPLLEITGVECDDRIAWIHGRPRPGAARRFPAVARTLAQRGFELRLLDVGKGRVTAAVSVFGRPASMARRPALNVVLLLLTVLTTTWAGAWHRGIDLFAEPGRWTAGLPYALALIAILGVHEMGHYLVARRRGVRVTLPYFIPAPFSLGTFGAFIRMGGPVEDRATYFDVAAAGPFAGLVVAVAALAFGLGSAEPSLTHGVAPESSVLLFALFRLFGPGAMEARAVLGPIGFAGWLGLVITALNLLPVGQLDGGHMAYAVLGRRRAATLSALLIGLLIAGGLLYSRHLLVWGFLAWSIAALQHPPAQNELAPIGPARLGLAIMSVVLLLAIMLPWPS